jgi:hypothetical protein
MHKTEYFRKQGWDEKWIETAKELARDIWRRNYRPKPLEPETTTSTEHGKKGKRVVSVSALVISY